MIDRNPRWRRMDPPPPIGALVDLWAEGPGKDAPLERYQVPSVWRYVSDGKDQYGNGYREVKQSKPLAWRYCHPSPSAEEQVALGIQSIQAALDEKEG